MRAFEWLERRLKAAKTNTYGVALAKPNRQKDVKKYVKTKQDATTKQKVAELMRTRIYILGQQRFLGQKQQKSI